MPRMAVQRSIPWSCAQRFDVGDQVRGGVGAQIGIGLAGERPAAPGAALVEEHDAVGVRIEEAPLSRPSKPEPGPPWR